MATGGCGFMGLPGMGCSEWIEMSIERGDHRVNSVRARSEDGTHAF